MSVDLIPLIWSLRECAISGLSFIEILLSLVMIVAGKLLVFFLGGSKEIDIRHLNLLDWHSEEVSVWRGAVVVWWCLHLIELLLLMRNLIVFLVRWLEHRRIRVKAPDRLGILVLCCDLKWIHWSGYLTDALCSRALSFWTVFTTWYPILFLFWGLGL